MVPPEPAAAAASPPGGSTETVAVGLDADWVAPNGQRPSSARARTSRREDQLELRVLPCTATELKLHPRSGKQMRVLDLRMYDATSRALV